MQHGKTTKNRRILKINCKNCEKEIYKRPSVVEQSKNNFCSHKCYSTYSRGGKRNLKDNRIGKKYGLLTVIAQGEGKIYNGKRRKVVRTWIVECECGNIKELPTQSLKHTKSCGCIMLRPEHGWLYEKDRLNSVVKEHYRSYIKGAKKRNLLFDITLDEFKDIIIKNCYYCGDINPIKTRREEDRDKVSIIGIDRIDNKKGYIENNIVPCCSMCNFMKGNYSMKEFINQATKINDNIREK